MKRTILLYGVAFAVLVTLLKIMEYRYFIHDLSMEFYIGAVAVLFTGIGVWSGLRLTRRKTVLFHPNFVLDTGAVQRLGISSREMEVLVLVAQGLSNQEIADKLFISLQTVKTHTSNLFVKLNVKRRTQAIQRGKEFGLLSR